MGLYDIMANGEQVKCFYLIAFLKDEYTTEKNNGFGNTIHIGGYLRNFIIGSKLPIKTKYYKYPENFCIFDYRCFDNNIHIVRNGIYNKYVHASKFSESDLQNYWIDYYGNSINIQNIEDIQLITNDFKKYRILRNEIIQKYDISKLLNIARKMKDDQEEFGKIIGEFNEIINKCDALLKKRDKELSEINIMDKWYRNEYVKEKQFGEFWKAFDNREKRVSESSLLEYNYEQEYVDCKDAFKNFIKSNSGIIDKYIKWQKLSHKDIDKLMEVIKKVEN